MMSLIGYLATILTLLSFSFKNIKKLRIVSSIACMSWILYGILRHDMPIIWTNTCIITIHSYYLLIKKS